MRFWHRKAPLEALETAVSPKVETAAVVGAARLSQRAFLKALAGVVGGVTGAFIASGVRTAEAGYQNGTLPAGPDVVNTNLLVQGNLIVQASTSGAGLGYVGIGTTPQGELDVAGEIAVVNGGNRVVAIGTDGVVKQSYYAP